MNMYILKLNGEIKIKTKSYLRLYRYLEKSLKGGLSYGMDRQTLHALGYEIIFSTRGGDVLL